MFAWSSWLDGVPFTPIGKTEGREQAASVREEAPVCLWQADGQSTADPVKASGASCLGMKVV